MGVVFVVIVVPEEALWLGAMFEVDDQSNEVNLSNLYGSAWRGLLFEKEKLLAKHPTAYWRFPIVS